MPARAFLVLATVVFGASVLGLASAHAFSVSFWPANAVLVGCMLRNRRLIGGAGWFGAFAGFITADLLFGRTLWLSAAFAGTNLFGTMVTTAALARLDEADLGLRRAHAVPYLGASLLPGCIAAGLGGALLVVFAFGGSATQALLTWPASELVNYLVVLPAILTIGRGSGLVRQADGPGQRRPAAWPMLLLILSCAAAVWFDGPGSIMFPMPALLLCALAYSLPVTALLTMALGTGSLVVLGLGIMDIGQDMAVPATVVSIRVAIAFLVLVPLTISSVMVVRDDLLHLLQHAAEHDGLTGLLNRRTFEQRMQALSRSGPQSEGGWMILWIDIDRFKSINDGFGHLAGDAVLQTFTAVARRCCGQHDLIGRIGGEEFGILASVPGPSAATALADRLRRAFAAQPTAWKGTPIRATISIGAAYLDAPPSPDTDLGPRLDEALYRAKHQGRDRVEWVGTGRLAAHHFAPPAQPGVGLAA